ncbi:phosphoadenylylsulfate reductase [Moraxella caviae]|uniref:Phosphoadenosine phosphosulfate reductase n=1 Tax=Moraxella caviae TaxID=34060 RepID=A0A1T0A4K9_9GAMM|nr:phosphoadenosine phosphosulfate reductase family protein [Moraxella caviae]OOR90693.1 phosphoadenylylsulfate reductase [Moraxella caviae]STZ14838.1 Phosphoadenosine phosphosulfate reductase [Moraxella caviae]VEW11269.1 Phosphoadenosine phosphosulfate reductase [Moraxella caviae]
MAKTIVTTDNLAQYNAELTDKSPEQIVQWALSVAKNPIITTNFRPYEAAILHLVTRLRPDITVLFVDSGYNTDATYRYAQSLIRDLNLNVVTYIPAQTRAFRDVAMGGIPDVDSPLHAEFTEQVKLEPFRRALGELDPDVWFNAIRKDQTEFRGALDVLSLSKDGVLKVAPLFHLSEAELDAYQEQHGLPNEFDYFDPTKVLAHRECGLHTQL